MSSALIALLLLLVGGFARADVYALVVNKENPLTSISKAAVLRIFKADTQHWEGGDPITLYLPKSQTKEKGFLLREVYQMTDEELKRYWTELVYRNKINEPPRAQSTGAVVVGVVSKSKNAIAIVNVNALPKGADVKVLEIDDHGPGSDEYFFRDHDKPKPEAKNASGPAPVRDHRDALAFHVIDALIGRKDRWKWS